MPSASPAHSYCSLLLVSSFYPELNIEWDDPSQPWPNRGLTVRGLKEFNATVLLGHLPDWWLTLSPQFQACLGGSPDSASNPRSLPRLLRLYLRTGCWASNPRGAIDLRDGWHQGQEPKPTSVLQSFIVPPGSFMGCAAEPERFWAGLSSKSLGSPHPKILIPKPEVSPRGLKITAFCVSFCNPEAS